MLKCWNVTDTQLWGLTLLLYLNPPSPKLTIHLKKLFRSLAFYNAQISQVFLRKKNIKKKHRKKWIDFKMFHHLPDLPGFTRSIYRRDHALISPESHVYGPLPDWYSHDFAHLFCLKYWAWSSCPTIALTGSIHLGHI